MNNSDTTTYRNREPVYDGKAKSCDKLKIDWNAYVEVKGISFTLDNTIDTSKLWLMQQMQEENFRQTQLD